MSFEQYVSSIPEYNTSLNAAHSCFDKIMAVFGYTPVYFAVPQASLAGPQLILPEKAPAPEASYIDRGDVDTTGKDLSGADPDQPLFLHFWVDGMSGFSGLGQTMQEFRRESVNIGCRRLLLNLRDAGVSNVAVEPTDLQVSQVTAILEA